MTKLKNYDILSSKSKGAYQKYGEILYEEASWTGKKSVSIQGVPLQAISKNTFSYNRDGNSTTVLIKGNSVTGVALSIEDDTIQLVPAPKWYEIVFSAIIFLFVLIWGNSVTLCSIFPIIGGAIGGLISAVFAIINLNIIRKKENVGIKALISLGFLVLTVLVCFVIAMLLIGLLT